MIHAIFRKENLAGLSDCLIGEARLEDATKSTDIPNLDLLTSGTLPPNPSELLGSESMKRLIDQLKSIYDVILFDSPPVIHVVDTIVLGSLVDGIGLVCRSEKTTLPLLKQSIERIQENKIRVLGIILNDYNLDAYASQYGYYNYYQDSREPQEEESLPPSTL